MEKFSWKGHGAMLLANTSWGLMSPLAKVVMAGGVVTPFVLTDLRIFGAMVLFWAVSLFQKPEHVPPRDMLRLFAASLLAIVFNQGSFIFGVKLSSPADASIITTSMPLWAMLLAAVFLREPVTGKKVAGIAFGAGGALMLILGSGATATAAGAHPILGDLLVLFAQLSYATYLVLFKNFICRYSLVTVMKWMFTYAFLCTLPFSYSSLVATDWLALGWDDVLAVAFIVVFATFVSYMFIISHGGWNVQLRAARGGVCSDGLSRARLVQRDEGACRGDDFCGRVSRHNEQEPRRRAPRGTTVT